MASEEFVKGKICEDLNLSFINCPPKKSRPSGRETKKCSNAVKFVIDNVVKQTNASLNDVNGSPAPLWGTLEKSLLKAINQMRMIAKQHALMANHQIMMQAPVELQQKYFDEVYASSILAATNSHLEEKTRQVESRARKVTLEKKIVEFHLEIEGGDSISCEESVSMLHNTSQTHNISHWVELACNGEVNAADLVKSCYGNEFACLHNRDSTDFMNESKFERFILKCTNNDVPFSWDLLDETGRHIVMEKVEDKEQGLSKEWGQFGWYRFPSNEQIESAMQGRHIGMAMML